MTETKTALITLSPLAIEKLKAVMEEQGETDSALRVLLVPMGQGVQYMLSLDKEVTEDDITLHQDGVRLLVDRDSAPLLEGTTIDYHEDLMRSGFVIDNPNIARSGSCACGGAGACACGGH